MSEPLTQFQCDVLKAFGLKPWQVGLGPVPRWVRIRAPFMRLWLKATRRW